MHKPEKRKLERVRYWQGQMLRSRDFRDIEAGDAQRRWWHNRALHNAYGVAEGLTCSLIPTSNPTGISILPGVAYDISGRELILEKPRVIPLAPNISPTLVGAVSLLMRYKPPLQTLRPGEAAELGCAGCGSIAAGTAEFVWRIGDNLNPAEGVSVCAVSYSRGGGRKPDPSFVRSSILPEARPLLASGATIPGNTPWNPWSAGFQTPQAIGVQTWIDTSAAGFTQVPCYLAWLQGSLLNPQTLELVPAIFPSIADESILGFTFRLWLPNENSTALNAQTRARRAASAAASAVSFSLITNPADFSVFAQQQKLYVSWIGCQMMPQSGASCCGPQGFGVSGATNQVSIISSPSL